MANTNDRDERNRRDDARTERARAEADKVRAAADKAREEEARKKRETKEAWAKSFDNMMNVSGDGSALASHISGGKTRDIQDFGLDRVTGGLLDKIPTIMPSDIFTAGIEGVQEVGEAMVNGTVNGIRKMAGFKDEDAQTPESAPATPKPAKNNTQPAQKGSQPAPNPRGARRP
jgi:hypothetical protein